MTFLSDLVTRCPSQVAGLEPHKPEPTRQKGALPALTNKVWRTLSSSPAPRNAMPAYPDLHLSADITFPARHITPAVRSAQNAVPHHPAAYAPEYRDSPP